MKKLLAIVVLGLIINNPLNAESKLERKNLNKLYCKDVKEKRIPQNWGTSLFFDGTEIEINSYTAYFYKNSFYKLINKHEKKNRYVELDMTSSPYSEFYTDFNYYNNELNYTFYGLWGMRTLNRDGKKIKEYYKKNRNRTGMYIIKLNKQTLNGSYEFKSSPMINYEYKDTTGEFKCEISSRKI